VKLAARASIRALAGAIAALFAIVVLALPRPASAREQRPWDAPALDPDHRSAPPLPPEYVKEDEQGIRIAYQPSTRDRVRSLHAGAVAIRAELSAALGREVLATVEIRVAASPSEMARLAPTEQLSGYATAVAFGELRLVVMSALSPLSLDTPNLEGWLRHALAHVALDEVLDHKPIPRWLHEGFAAHFSGEDGAARAEALCLAALGKGLLGLPEIDAQFPAEAPQGSLAFAEAADFARFLASTPRRERFTDLLGRVRAGEDFRPALAGAYGADPEQVELGWRREMARRYSFVPVLAGATLLWAVVALVVTGRRIRAQRRRARALARRDAGDRQTRITLAAVRTPARGPRGRVLDDEPMGEPLPPDPEVPKVEHGGRWYTLH
jgi:Peptidase MA superfamily